MVCLEIVSQSKLVREILSVRALPFGCRHQKSSGHRKGNRATEREKDNTAEKNCSDVWSRTIYSHTWG